MMLDDRLLISTGKVFLMHPSCTLRRDFTTISSVSRNSRLDLKSVILELDSLPFLWPCCCNDGGNRNSYRGYTGST